MTPPARRVLYDGEAFIRHRRSGITRYFAEMIGEFRADPGLGVDAITPYRWVANAHLVHRNPRRYTHIPVPPARRVQVLERLNRRRVANAPAADLLHHSVYDPAALTRWTAPLRVCTVYDFTFERMPEVFPDLGSSVPDKNLFIDSCDALLCISQATRDDLHVFHPNLDKYVAVTPLGAAAEFYDPAPVRIKDLPERYLLHVGNRHHHKNVDLLFRVFAEIGRTDPDLRLVLSGASLPDETDRLRELGILERTVRLRVGDDELPWLYSRAVAFVFPSRYEGFGLPVVEAMAAGCPVVTTDIAVMHEVGGDAIAYTDPDDDGRLVEVLGPLLTGTADAERMRAAGRLRARDFTWRRTAAATARAYADIAAQ